MKICSICQTRSFSPRCLFCYVDSFYTCFTYILYIQIQKRSKLSEIRWAEISILRDTFKAHDHSKQIEWHFQLHSHRLYIEKRTLAHKRTQQPSKSTRESVTRAKLAFAWRKLLKLLSSIWKRAIYETKSIEPRRNCNPIGIVPARTFATVCTHHSAHRWLITFIQYLRWYDLARSSSLRVSQVKWKGRSSPVHSHSTIEAFLNADMSISPFLSTSGNTALLYFPI